MSVPTPPPPPPIGSPATARGAQTALCVFLAVLVGLLAFRGYGNHLGARPTEPVAADLTDLNSADEKELAQVPGVGPKLAQAIADHRRLKGPFRSVDELNDVRGVGPVTFEKVRDRFRAGAGAAPPSTFADVPPSPNPAPTPSPPVAPARPPASRVNKIQPGEPPINVNTASAEELQRLPAVGPVMAQAIIAARTASPFESVSDLDRVKGIGPKTLDKLRPFVVVK